MAEAKERPIEDRIRAIEDRLAIYNLIASHPPSADTGAQSYIRSIFADDGVLDLAGLPHVELDGDRAVVTSYLQIISPDTLAEPVEVPAHGVSKGYRIHRVGANRWELARTRDGWKIKRRVFRSLDGSADALDILRQALAG